VDFGDLTETLEKLCQTFASWALVAAFVTTAVDVLHRIAREFMDTTEPLPDQIPQTHGGRTDADS